MDPSHNRLPLAVAKGVYGSAAALLAKTMGHTFRIAKNALLSQLSALLMVRERG